MECKQGRHYSTTKTALTSSSSALAMASELSRKPYGRDSNYVFGATHPKSYQKL